MSRRRSLQRSLLAGVVLYAAILSMVVAGHGYWVNERAEASVWESLLHSEMRYFLTRLSQDPAYTGPDTDALRFYDSARFASSPFAALPAGVHDEVRVGGREYVVLVERQAQAMRALALDITDQEQGETALTFKLAASVFAVAAFMAALAYWGFGRLLDPLRTLAERIGSLPPDGRGPAIDLPGSAPAEAAVVADAVNRYRDNIRGHIDRERAFINLASHELRTPIAVVSSATEVALAHPHTSDELRPHILRAHRTAAEMQELAAMLLALARTPERALRDLPGVDIAPQIRQVVEDFAFLAQAKELAIEVDEGSLPHIRVPAQVLRAVVGNLIRNAIENSDRGSIRIHAPDPLTLVVEDTGHGMSSAELGQLYTSIARTGYAAGGGIGLGLISRICDHFGWQLQLRPAERGGTVASVRFSAD